MDRMPRRRRSTGFNPQQKSRKRATCFCWQKMEELRFFPFQNHRATVPIGRDHHRALDKRFFPEKIGGSYAECTAYLSPTLYSGRNAIQFYLGEKTGRTIRFLGHIA